MQAVLGPRKESSLAAAAIVGCVRAGATVQGPANVWWLAGPCTSFCDWGLQNNGTRSFQRPEGGSDGRQLTENEEIGNILSEVEAELLLTALETGPSRLRSPQLGQAGTRRCGICRAGAASWRDLVSSGWSFPCALSVLARRARMASITIKRAWRFRGVNL